jgi:glycosyltransferase involved in cell wall biosynthesis/SAM-dependent methyltransferase
MDKFYFPIQPIRECVVPQLPLDIRITTPGQNFGSRGGAREINALYVDVLQDGVIWQPDVYAEARAIADQFGINHIIDIGCGNGEKLIHFFPAELFQTTGIDFYGSLVLAQANYPDRHFFECDLSSSHELTQVFSRFDYDEPVLLILSDVIEHISDPRFLLAQLRTVLLNHPLNRLIISTPDRAMLGYKSDDLYPKNPAHVREWTLDEFVTFCQAAGFQVERCGHTRANQFDDHYTTIYAQLRCDLTSYLKFLQVAGLLHGNSLPTHLLIANEYARLHKTGGIGTFVSEQRMICGVENTLCLFVGRQENLDPELFQSLKILRPEILVSGLCLTLPIEDLVLVSTQQLLFYFPNIRAVEYADYQGYGCRLAQAKRAGILPEFLNLIVYCHGNTHYLENANQVWYGLSHLNIAEKEKISIEYADKVVFPTKFLLDLYREIGIDIAKDKIIQLRYPYHIESTKIDRTEKFSTLVFYGKRSVMKGFGLFLGAIELGASRLHSLGIRKLVLIGPRLFENAEEVQKIDMLRSQFEVIELTSLGHREAIETLRNYGHCACCVMPYLGDNYPYAMLDATFAGILPVMVRAGGVPEMYPTPFDKILLSDPTEVSLLNTIVSLVELSTEERHQLRIDFLNTMESAQAEFNKAFFDFCFGNERQDCVSNPVQSKSKATVIVPVFNTDLNLISDLVFGINNQSFPPAEVIFINDASQQGYAEQLDELLRRELRMPFRIISHPVNKGLAGARNTGLHAANTEYIINIDSDDVPRTDFIKNIVYRLDADPACAAAVPYMKSFSEEADFNEQRLDTYIYRPLGDGVIAAQLDNILGHANSGYRTSVIRAFGGWDESDKSMWEDWALYLKLVSSGYRIGVIPQVDILYRVRKQSMSRTYKVWPAMRRLARNTVGLPRFESFRLQAMMRENSALASELNRQSVRFESFRLQAMMRENSALASELNRQSVRAVRRIVAYLAKYPRTFRVTRSLGLGIWKFARYIRNLYIFR